jgi:alpha-L-fucosidase
LKITATILLLCTLVCPAAAQTTSAAPAPAGPVPSARQLRWHSLEYCAFVHFNMNTFTGREWGDGTEDPNLFQPDQLDCRQWVRIFRDAGMKGVIITAKHHDGFCLWPSSLTEHSVRSSSWRGGHGDVLRELSAACREYGLRFGVYLSPWDRHDRRYGTDAYNGLFAGQLKEVLTNYGEVFEVWFDGANGEGPNGRKQVYDWTLFNGTVRELQPGAVIFSDCGPDIRWAGDEDGYADETNWSSLRRDEIFPGYDKPEVLRTGHADGAYWVPAECDVSIRPGWYYHSEQDTQVKPAAKLMEIYLTSVGRNAGLLLNVPVNRKGLIDGGDSAALMGLRKILDSAFATNLASGAMARASAERGDGYGPRQAVDGAEHTYWSAPDTARTAELVLTLRRPARFNCVKLQEYIPLGQRVSAFAVDITSGGVWTEVARGTTIGRKRLLRIRPATATGIRVRILSANACPAISELGLYTIPEP